MKCKILENEDIELMKEFVDDDNTKYTKEKLLAFINQKNTYGFIAKIENRIIGFCYGCILFRPDGKKDFYMHAIDIQKEYQGKGYGTELIKYAKEYIKNIGCREMFLITNKSNKAACRCYEKAGGIAENNDDIVYVF